MPRFTGRPVYLQIADDLRRQILNGSLAGGAQLPSIAELADEYDTSSVTVRQALSVLRNEGLIYGHQGKGSFVRPSKPRRIRAVRHLYSTRPTSSPLAKSVEKEGGRPSWDHQSSREQATPAIAGRLNVEPGDPVMTTRYRFFADDEPIMLSTSHEPLAITGGTAVELPEDGPITGVVPRMDSIGVHIAYVQEDVTARAPQPYEAEALQVPTGVPVMVIQRTYYTNNDEPVETADVIVGADTYALSYVVPIPDR